MHVYWSLILKFFQGECSEEEIRQLEQWRNSNPDNQRFFEELAEIWQTSGELYKTYEPDKEKVWDQMSKRLSIYKEAEKKSKKRVLLPYIRWAAAIVLLVSVAMVLKFLTIRNTEIPNIIALRSGSNKATYLLPDSSLVILDKNTILQYKRKFKDGVREVNLKGTAYFEVKPNKSRPFKVNTLGSVVEVVGTSFYLGADSVLNTVNLIVITGKVRFYNMQNKKAITLVMKDEKAVFNATSGTIQKEETYNPNEIVWKTGNFIFEEEKLGRICDLLSNYYNIKISLADTSMKNRRLTAGFHKQPLINIIKAIETTFDIKADTINHTLVLSNK